MNKHTSNKLWKLDLMTCFVRSSIIKKMFEDKLTSWKEETERLLKLGNDLHAPSPELHKHIHASLYACTEPDPAEKRLFDHWEKSKNDYITQIRSEMMINRPDITHKHVLKRRTVFFDLETTGLDVDKDRIIEISVISCSVNGKQQSKTIRINPEMNIPSEASNIHGIKDRDVIKCPTFRDLAHKLKAVFCNSDLVGYNINKYDIPLLTNEFKRAGIEDALSTCKSIDLLPIFSRDVAKRNLSTALRYYTGRPLLNAHTAEADTNACLDIFSVLTQKDRIESTPIAEPPKPTESTKKRSYYTAAAGISFTETERYIWKDRLNKHKGLRITDENVYLINQPNNGEKPCWYREYDGNCPVCKFKGFSKPNKANVMDQMGWGWRCFMHVSIGHKDIMAKLDILQG
jgi:DNA polymerase III epsilon subunit-like protein